MVEIPAVAILVHFRGLQRTASSTVTTVARPNTLALRECLHSSKLSSCAELSSMNIKLHTEPETSCFKIQKQLWPPELKLHAHGQQKPTTVHSFLMTLHLR
ncbi:hypothetical protein L798_04147 [Zootermopsis nevadensis]|uniref:Uncharacterized protein n=1 Tax=Zootermopsis nevadensis TaxID=136037 RepID=A0A067RLE8_ZOONE|nr:hypothetical protein L798_04147 [Zootermopsis nevadensis]